jgi:small conductance mechanosensitive channel
MLRGSLNSRSCAFIAIVSLSIVSGARAFAQAQPTPTAAPKIAPKTALVSGSAPAASPELDATGPIETAEGLPAMLERLAQSGTEVDTLRRKAESAAPEEADLLSPQIADVSTRYRRLLTEVAARISAQASTAKNAAELTAAKASVLWHLANEERRILSDLDQNERSASTLRVQVDKSSEDDRPRLVDERKARIALAPKLLSDLDANYQARKGLGENVAPAIAAFKKRLTEAARSVDAELHSVAERLKRQKASKDEAIPLEKDPRQADLIELRSLLADWQKKQLELMDEQGIDTSGYRQSLIRTTGEVSEDILNADVATGLLATVKDDAIDWLKEHTVTIAFKVTSFFFILFLFAALGRVGRWLARRAVHNTQQISSLAADFLVKGVGRLIVFAGWVIAAAQIGIEVGPLLAGLGIAGFVLGFALQATLSNFASGMMIIVYRPFDIGDVIEAGGVMGKVSAMNLVSTSVLTFDNQLLVVPNSKIWGDVIRNVTHEPNRRVDLTFGVGYADDVDQARRVLEDILSKNERVLQEPAPLVRLHELADSSVNFVVRPWVKTADYWDAYWEITREVKQRFDAEGISIPFPQRDVHVYSEPAVARSERASHTAPIRRSPVSEVASDDRDIEAEA